MNNKKAIIALALVALVGIVGGTFAYFTSTSKLTNTFTTGTYSTSVKEEFVSPDNWTPGTTTTKRVNVTNNGSVDIAVRATYTEKWTAADGTTVLSGTRNGEKIAQFTTGADWEESLDGYYYYKGTLKNGEASSDFISSVTFNPNFTLKEGTDISCTTSTVDGKTTVSCVDLDSGYAGATYSLDITIETIQADQKWTYTAGHTYEIGEIVTIGAEKFNVIKDNGDTVTMLAQNLIDSNYRQSENAGAQVPFSNSNGWEYTPGPKEIDIQLYDGPVKTYVNNYVSYLQGETGDNTVTGTLITLSELKDLGCTIKDDYSHKSGLTCANSEYEWVAIKDYWWTRSARSDNTAARVWGLRNDGSFASLDYSYSGNDGNGGRGVRPVITISKTTLANL